ncbi:serine--tRNA ligase [Pseudomonadota bacterium]
MLDPQQLRKDIDTVVERLRTRGFEFELGRYQDLESRRKDLQVATQALQNERNTHSREIGRAKSRGEDASELLKTVGELGDELKTKAQELDALQNELADLVSGVPNLPHSSVSVGGNESDNAFIRAWGEPPQFDFPVRDHVDVGQSLGLMDFDAAAKITGSRFVVMQGQLARLHRALTQYMLDVHTIEHGYVETYVPYLVNSDSLFGTGQLPKFADDQFVTREEDWYLIPTAEVPVTNLFRDEILDASDLPIKRVAHTPCFRREAGSYGKDTRGMIRQHQFEKVELVQVVHPDKSYEALEELTGNAETILQRLELPYRVVSLCTGDLGFSSAKTYDIEVWLPSQQTYREISSCSNFEGFQARRMRARFRDAADRKSTAPVHTLNGSGLAVGRTLVAVMENYQNSDGSITVPAVLHAYTGGLKVINRTA